jgi:hypothetical protein
VAKVSWPDGTVTLDPPASEQLLFLEALLSSLSFCLPRRAVGAQPRNLQFRGPFLEMFLERA